MAPVFETKQYVMRECKFNVFSHTLFNVFVKIFKQINDRPKG